MDYYNGEDTLEDEWVWHREEEREPPRSYLEIKKEEEKVTVEEEDESVGGADDHRKVEQEDEMPDVQEEDSVEGGTGDIDWGRRFEAEVLRKEVSDWLAEQRMEQERHRVGQVDTLELLHLARQGWEENLKEWAQRTEEVRSPSFEYLAEDLTKHAQNLEAPRLERMILFSGVAVTILGSLVFLGFFGCCCWVAVGCLRATAVERGRRPVRQPMAGSGGQTERGDAAKTSSNTTGTRLFEAEEVNNYTGDEVDGGAGCGNEGNIPLGRMTLRDRKQDR